MKAGRYDDGEEWLDGERFFDWLAEQALELGRERGMTDDEIAERLVEVMPRIIDALPELVIKATDAGADATFQELMRTMPRVLRARRREQRGFERRLGRHWRNALDLYFAIYTACVEVGSTYNAEYGEAASLVVDWRFGALIHLHARACTTASEVYALLRTGHGPGAQARWRTLYEIAVVASLLGDADPSVSERFLLHADVENHKDALEYQAHCVRLGYEPLDAAEMAEMESEAKALEARFGSEYCKDWGWALPLFPGRTSVKFWELGQRAGLDQHRPFFRLASHGTHAGSKGAHLNRVEAPDGEQYFVGGGTNRGLADPGQGALIALVQVTTVLLADGRGDTVSPRALVEMKVLQRLVESACDAFAAAELELDD